MPDPASTSVRLVCTINPDKSESCLPAPPDFYGVINEYSDLLGDCIPPWTDKLGNHNTYKEFVSIKDSYGVPMPGGYYVCLDNNRPYEMGADTNCFNRYNGTQINTDLTSITKFSTTAGCSAITPDKFNAITAPATNSIPNITCPVNYNAKYGYYTRMRTNGSLSTDIKTANKLSDGIFGTYKTPENWYCILDPTKLNTTKIY